MELRDGWEAAVGAPLDWIPARVPGTAAAALADAGLWVPGDARDFDAEDWWFRTRFDAAPAAPDEEVLLCFGGIATVSEVTLNGEAILDSASMFARHGVDVGARLRDEGNELVIHCRALAPLLAERRKPRARWRTRLADGNLRWFRTMLLGRAPGFAPAPAAVGPWRPVSLERRSGAVLEELRLRTRLEGSDGVLSVRASVRGGTTVEVELGGQRAPLAGGTGELRVPNVERWWPHTHGEPVLHDVRLHVDGSEMASRRVGFRELSPGTDDVLEHGLDLHVNGVRVFARGAVWTPVDFVSLAPSDAELRAALERVRDAGMNMLRIPGTGCYESPAFHDLCDELGLLVWQEFMFANMDYPIADEGFRALVEAEARDVLAEVAGRPSTVVLCGNSEVEQQVAMLGLDPALGRGELFGELLPAWAREAGADAVYVPSAPCGGELPFRTDRGIANYYGVGGYRRDLSDARLAGVRFAAECLAFANVADDGSEAFVPRDAGADWDFADVRDHYLRVLFGLDPDELRAADRERYLELSGAVSGEVMAEVFGEWRRAGSPCGGGLVLWLRDLVPGTGWGLLDSGGAPKHACSRLAQALAPVAVWTTDEGLNGVDVHIANDRRAPLAARLRVALYADGERPVDGAVEDVELGAHGSLRRSVEGMLGRFVDASYAYRFGPPAHDAIVASLEAADGALLSQAVRFPAGYPLAAEPATRLGLEARVDGPSLTVRSRRLAYGVRIHAPGFAAAVDAFTVEPGGERGVTLLPRERGAELAGATLTAINLEGRIRVL